MTTFWREGPLHVTAQELKKMISHEAPLHVAVHEMGHAAATWLLGGSVYYAQIKTSGELLRSKEGYLLYGSRGLVRIKLGHEAAKSSVRFSIPMICFRNVHGNLHNIDALGLVSAAIGIAGPKAQAHYLHRACATVAHSTSSDDMRQVEQTMAGLCPDRTSQEILLYYTNLLTKRLLRGKMPKILGLANNLYQHKMIRKKQLDSLLSSAFGPKPHTLTALQIYLHDLF